MWSSGPDGFRDGCGGNRDAEAGVGYGWRDGNGFWFWKLGWRGV